MVDYKYNIFIFIVFYGICLNVSTAELQWLEQAWDHENWFQSKVVLASQRQFACFKKFRKKSQTCGGIVKKRDLDTTVKCCLGRGQGFTLQGIDKLGKNKYSCMSCYDWENEQTHKLTTPAPVKFTCFRRYRKKVDQCSGVVVKLDTKTPDACCEEKGQGFTQRDLNVVGKNRYTCVSCYDWERQKNEITTKQTFTTTTTDSPEPAEWGEWGDCSITCGAGWRSRYRQCEDCDRNHYRNVQSQPCVINYYCPLDGSWGPWLPWQPCTASCNGGTQRRERQCNYPPPIYGGRDCEGAGVEEEACNEQPCPVDGNWGEWSRFSYCSATCGPGVMSRTRECDSPTPENGGENCKGRSFDSRRCENRRCPIHGGWSEWGEFSPCPVTCGTGMRTRTRACNRPRPVFGGRDCEGSDEDVTPCDTGFHCPIHGGWSEWVRYGRCNADSCQTGQQLRTRVCNNPRPQHRGLMCRGNSVEQTECFNNDGTCKIDGGWCRFENWSTCTATCSSYASTQIRRRRCLCPAPQNGGQYCEGEDFEVQECRGIPNCEEPTVDVDTG